MDTERRSFLAAALAWLASLVALVWPRRALSAPSRRGPFTRPSRPAEPAPAFWRQMPDGADTARVYRDMGRMLDDMHDHLCLTGHSVLCADDPERLRIGFVTFNATGDGDEGMVRWQCTIPGAKDFMCQLESGNVPRSFGAVSGSDAAALLRDCFKSGEGKLRLAMALEGAGRARFNAGLGPLPHNS